MTFFPKSALHQKVIIHREIRKKKLIDFRDEVVKLHNAFFFKILFEQKIRFHHQNNYLRFN